MATLQRVALYILFDALERDLVEHIRKATQGRSNFLTDDERSKARKIAESRPDLLQIAKMMGISSPI